MNMLVKFHSNELGVTSWSAH